MSSTQATTAQSQVLEQPKAPNQARKQDGPVTVDPQSQPSGSVLPRGEQAPTRTVDPELQKLIDAIPENPVIPELPKLSRKERQALTPEQVRARAELKRQREEAQKLARKYTDQRKALQDVERIEYVINPQTGLPVINPKSGTPWRRIIYKKPSVVQAERMQRQAERAAERRARKEQSGLEGDVVITERASTGETTTPLDYSGVTVTNRSTGEVLKTPEQNQRFFEATRTKDGYPDTLGGQELKQAEAIEFSQAMDQFMIGARETKPVNPRADTRAEGWKPVKLTAEELAEEAAKTPRQRRQERLNERAPRPAEKGFDEWYETLTPEARAERIKSLEAEFERKRNAPIPKPLEGMKPKDLEDLKYVQAKGQRLQKSPEEIAAIKAAELAEKQRLAAETAMMRAGRNPKTRKRIMRARAQRRFDNPPYPDNPGSPLHAFSRADVKGTLREGKGSFYDQINDTLNQAPEVLPPRTSVTSTFMDEITGAQKAAERKVAAPKPEGVDVFVSRGFDDYEQLLAVEREFELQKIVTRPGRYSKPVKEGVFVRKPNKQGEVVPMPRKKFDTLMKSSEFTRDDLLRLIESTGGKK